MSLGASLQQQQQSQQQMVVCTAKAMFRYDGRPAPPFAGFPALLFTQGDLIQVTDDDDDDWWRGYILVSILTLSYDMFLVK